MNLANVNALGVTVGVLIIGCTVGALWVGGIGPFAPPPIPVSVPHEFVAVMDLQVSTGSDGGPRLDLADATIAPGPAPNLLDDVGGMRVEVLNRESRVAAFGIHDPRAYEVLPSSTSDTFVGGVQSTTTWRLVVPLYAQSGPYAFDAIQIVGADGTPLLKLSTTTDVKGFIRGFTQVWALP